MEFHVSREARDRYEFNQTLFSYTGNVVFANVGASRDFAHRMNERNGADKDPSKTINPGALYAMGLIDEMSHVVVDYYRRQVDPTAIASALAWFDERLGKEELDKTILAFVEQFPTVDVYRDQKPPAEWLAGSTDGIPNRAVAFEELMLLWLANANPAFKPFSELFADQSLAAVTRYQQLTTGLRDYFATRPPLTAKRQNLIDVLRAPALASPDSLSGQLAYIIEHWAELIGDALAKLMLALDVLKEEELAIWMRFHPPGANSAWRNNFPWNQDKKGEVPSYVGAQEESERFSQDQEWMPTTVLIAKSTYVWLEQLSRQYGRHIYRLDHIPDDELRRLAHRGINSLWLIGVWERSVASQTIKQLCGNHDAVASAYSLYGYDIANDLGGEPAYRDLRDRAFAHGIRLASDMVPNHMGIDSGWVIEHPEWFMSRSDSPYPAYRFEGPDLSRDGRVEIKIEDHYYEQSDAAVVFRRRDKWTGDTRYVYHGNDGTSFPWNDTAQLDYLNPATREQVIQTILHVARLFPIIRFDAAMTLAKRHFQRLWFPIPGTGGAIPSRAEYSMSKADFDRAMPEEFWREVVDRVAREVPGTLLLAEAFWLMEGYFVRTLGMHRVYNSAFMNMMRDEDNAKYRSVIKNTIEFDPDILKRYVNFMSNPDERTAIDQFGNGDKCFGVATMMSTLPGLPMFGHGQIEGFTEKYGMEFRRARYQEDPDPGLVARHDREIAPLLHKRWLFAESENFLLYDFFRPDGYVDENVFAYSNRRGDHRALVIYHNKFASTYGTIHRSAAYADKGAGHPRQRTLGEAFGLPNDGNLFLAYRDLNTGLEHLMRASRLVSEGFSVELHAYNCHVYLDWRELRPDADHRWDLLCDHLNGRGAQGLDDALIALELAPLHETLVSLLRVDLLEQLADLLEPLPSCGEEGADSTPAAQLMQRIEERSLRFASDGLAILSRKTGAPIPVEEKALWLSICRRIHALKALPDIDSSEARLVLPGSNSLLHPIAVWGPALAYVVIDAMAGSVPSTSMALFDRLRLREPLARAFSGGGDFSEDGWRAAARVRMLFLVQMLTPVKPTKADEMFAGFPADIWKDDDARWLMEVHETAGEWYFNKELHQQMLWWAQLPDLLRLADPEALGLKSRRSLSLSVIEERVEDASEQGEEAGFRLGGKKPELAGKTSKSGKGALTK
ncbi:MAG TPA: alpha-amylase family glycosyl hydrolase [Acidobacteriaceae bacterium]|nr:alpha-amylase family glycosyl hydrolase [Acidobacteriaceae bacterium]